MLTPAMFPDASTVGMRFTCCSKITFNCDAGFAAELFCHRKTSRKWVDPTLEA